MSDAVAVALVEEDRPRVLDTYALVYAFTLAFLLPGAISIARLPFRTYTFAYVAPVTLVFVFGLAATFFTDSHDGFKTLALRTAVLTPLVLLTGVGVLFTAALGVVPISDYIKPEYFDTTKWVANALLLLLASPLVVAFVTRLRKPFDVQRVLQLAAIVFAVAVVATVAYLSVSPGHELFTMVRKDVMIYIVGGLVWYLPSFGIAAGVWRKVGPV
jgi:hypothetical protein